MDPNCSSGPSALNPGAPRQFANLEYAQAVLLERFDASTSSLKSVAPPRYPEPDLPPAEVLWIFRVELWQSWHRR